MAYGSTSIDVAILIDLELLVEFEYGELEDVFAAPTDPVLRGTVPLIVPVVKFELLDIAEAPDAV